MSQVYFICATPGSSGNFLIKLVGNLLGVGGGMTQPTFTQSPPDIMTRDFWFDNVNIGDEVIVHVPFYPDYEKLRTRFPGCKIIVMTHTLSECNTLARTLWKGFYKEAYDFGAEPFFRQILESHSHLFSSTTVTPEQLTNIEIETFIKILSYDKLLSGFHCLTIPDEPDIIEIRHKDFYYNSAQVRNQLEVFVGSTFPEQSVTFHNELVSIHIENLFLEYKS